MNVWHSMTLVPNDLTDGEHWLCIECGRQLLLWYPPNYKRKVLVPGDETACHTACKGGIAIGPVEVDA